MHNITTIVALSTVLVAGCASTFNAGGSAEYACPGMPNGVICKKPSEVYAETKNRNAALGSEVKSAGATTVRAPLPSTTDSLSGEALPISGNLAQPFANRTALLVPKPILEPAVVLRIWFAPYISDKGDLKYPSYVYSEITPRRWAFGEAAAKETRIVAPLQVEPRESGNFVSSPGGEDDAAPPRMPAVRNLTPTQPTTSTPTIPATSPR